MTRVTYRPVGSYVSFYLNAKGSMSEVRSDAATFNSFQEGNLAMRKARSVYGRGEEWVVEMVFPG